MSIFTSKDVKALSIASITRLAYAADVGVLGRSVYEARS